MACEKGYFNAEVNQFTAASCRPCPGKYSTTPGNASTSEADCICIAGYFNNATLPTHPFACVPCLSGTLCEDEGVTVATLPLKKGYFRLSLNSTDVKRCFDASRNCTLNEAGSFGLCEESTSACQGGTYSPSQARSYPASLCAPGLSGPYCELCEPSSETTYYYVTASEGRLAHCKACTGSIKRNTALVIGFGSLGFFVALGLAWYVVAKVPAMYKKWIVKWARVISLKTKLKHLYSFYAVVVKIDSVYRVVLPGSVRALVQAVSGLIDFGISFAIETPLKCLGYGSYLDTLRFWMLLPLLIIGLIVVVVASYLCALGKLVGHKTAFISTAMPPIMVVLFLACARASRSHPPNSVHSYPTLSVPLDVAIR